MTAEDKRVRIDKWLWAARFFKTRALAAAAVTGGKVDLNGEHTKPAKPVKNGDRMELRIGAYEWDIKVLMLSDRRGPASEAKKLYAETPESEQARIETAAVLRAERQSLPMYAKGRPTKRDRRNMIKFSRNNK